MLAVLTSKKTEINPQPIASCMKFRHEGCNRENVRGSNPKQTIQVIHLSSRSIAKKLGGRK